MTHYKIVITKYRDDGTAELSTSVEFDTKYTLAVDIPEWIRAEIDVNATITEDSYHNPANEPQCPEPGIKCVCWDIDHLG